MVGAVTKPRADSFGGLAMVAGLAAWELRLRVGMNFVLVSQRLTELFVSLDTSERSFRGENGRKGRSVKHLNVFSSHLNRPLSTSETAPICKQFARQNEPCKWG